MLKGLSGAGKSFFAKAWVADNPGSLRVNKDSLRAMCHDSYWSQSNEKIICDMRDAMVSRALESDRTVLVDDTNFHSSHEARLRQIAAEHKATFEIKDFEISFEEAIERDLKREHPVGYDVIKDQWNRYVRPNMKVEQNSTLPRAVCFDIDGTLALIGDRNPYDASTCESDLPNQVVVDLFHGFKAKFKTMVVFTGREDKYREQTVAWMDKYDIKPDVFAMRKTDDKRKDAIVKEELWRELVLPFYFTELVVDDRQQTCRGWRDLGLTVWQVADGEF